MIFTVLLNHDRSKREMRSGRPCLYVYLLVQCEFLHFCMCFIVTLENVWGYPLVLHLVFHAAAILGHFNRHFLEEP